ncbi:uncharacterized protein Fot_53933 [Forsythia ovata]|uniref:Uncharacterized protein n=1 Tax=Forsythia ovata TaxID=205694 RepID=A0ABD1PFK0_9LAMI
MGKINTVQKKLRALFRDRAVQTAHSILPGRDKYTNEEKSLLGSKEKPVKYLFWVLLWASVSLGLYALSRDAKATTDYIRASDFGVKVPNALRASGWPDEAVVFALAAFPVATVTVEERVEG